MTTQHYNISFTIMIDSDLKQRLLSESTKRKQKPSSYARQILSREISRTHKGNDTESELPLDKL